VVPRSPDEPPRSVLEAIGRLGALVPMAQADARQAHDRLDTLTRRVGELEADRTMRERAGNRWRGAARWIVEKFLVPLICVAAGALAAKKGWLP